jgi:hypothetical protein
MSAAIEPGSYKGGVPFEVVHMHILSESTTYYVDEEFTSYGPCGVV